MNTTIEMDRLKLLERSYETIKRWGENASEKHDIQSYIFSFEEFKNAIRGSVIKDDDLNRNFLDYMFEPIDVLYRECKNLYDDITATMEEAKAILDNHSYDFKYSIYVDCPFSLTSVGKTEEIDRLQDIITFYSEVVMSLKSLDDFAVFYSHAIAFQTNVEDCMLAIIKAVKKRIE